MIHIVLSRTALDSASNPNLNHPSAPQAPYFAFVSIFQLLNQILQTPNLQIPTLQTLNLQIPTLQTPNLQIPTLQTPNLQLLRTKLRSGTLESATSQPPAFLISPKLQ